MDSRKAYDLDGVLAEKPPLPNKKWGKMNGQERINRRVFLVDWYATCKPLIVWDGVSPVITSRKMEAANVTADWFKRHYNKVPRLYFLLESRNIMNVAKFKSGVIKAERITDFYEDNKKVLNQLKKVYPECTYHYVAPDLSTSVFHKSNLL